MRAFISYSHHDKAALDRLHVHLKNLTRGGHIETWYDRDILAGSDLNAEIERELEAADLFLLLVSPDFIASDFVHDHELPAINQRRVKDGALVIPVVLKPCSWQYVASNLQAIPSDADRRVRTISEWKPQTTGYNAACEQIGRAISAHFGVTPEAIKW